MSTIGVGSSPTGSPFGLPVDPATDGGTATPLATLTVPELRSLAPLADVLTGVRVLETGERGEHVRTLLASLQELGYSVPPAAIDDAIITRDAQNAIAAFQRDNGLDPTGTIDAATLAAIDRALAADPLRGKTFIDATTFAGQPAPRPWSARDNVELESTYTVAGIDGRRLAELLRETDARGRTRFRRMRRTDASAAFTTGFPSEEIPWDARSHALRERLPYVALTVEPDRFEIDPDDGRRELSLGTDIMDDTYYDTPEFTLLEHGMSLRGRVRWDNESTVRRLLVAAKFSSEVGPDGLKHAAKVDSRTSDGTHRATLDEDVRRGMSRWNGTDEPLPAVRAVYDKLTAAGALPDVAGHEDVLLLEPKAHLRSIRSRFHYNETPVDALRTRYRETGPERLEQALTALDNARNAGRVQPGPADAADTFERTARGILDASLVAERAGAALREIDPTIDLSPDAVRALYPDRASQPESYEQLEVQRVVAETLRTLYHEAGAQLAALRPALTGAASPADRALVEQFRAWLETVDPTLRRFTTPDRLLERHRSVALAAPDERQKQIDAFNAFATARRDAGDPDFADFEPLDAAGWARLGSALEDARLEVAARQLEAAGTFATQIWFDRARAFYVPESGRTTGNFLIDTIDYTEMVSHEDWESLSEAQRSPGGEIPLDKILHATLVNEVQIELGREKAYLDRIASLERELQTDRASLFMRWAHAAGHPALAGGESPEAYQKVLEELAARDDAALAPVLEDINRFLAEAGSALEPLTAADLRALPPELLTPEIRDRPVRTEPSTERMLAGARWVFEQYKDALRVMTEIKEPELMRDLERAGAPPTIRWAPAEAGKGEIALRALRDGVA
ncbi:MAG: peptidoglycan-binding protein [Planctomycetota bacterium]|nr:MAG: peptidoglycan-binding protein [Planctomycetota bacterium]